MQIVGLVANLYLLPRWGPKLILTAAPVIQGSLYVLLGCLYMFDFGTA